ncbi:MAG: hypothetical protein M3Y64_02525, partial [Gemmatimonadota bacterium]|nr:hypothetical protein [Gemmatimonadota bacterium]
MLAHLLRVAAVSIVWALPLCAQLRPMPSGAVHSPTHNDPAQLDRDREPRVDDAKARRAPLLAPLASLLMPGSGQALMRQQRSVGYLVVEGFLVLQAVRAQHDVNLAKANFRSIAANIARAGFGADRPNGPWDYYETLEEFSASGSYDLGGARFSPETDETTYNGLK